MSVKVNKTIMDDIAEDERYKAFKEDIKGTMDISEFLTCYKHKDKFRELHEWTEMTKFAIRLELETNPVPPVAYCLTQTDPSGYVKEERFVCWLPKEYGGTGEQIFGETAYDAIYGAIRHEQRKGTDQ